MKCRILRSRASLLKDIYRGVFQTREHTIREWSKYFEIWSISRGAWQITRT